MAFLACFFLIVLYQMFARYFSISVIWSDEASTYAFIWAVFMGAAVMLSEGAHFAFSGLNATLKGRAGATVNIIIDLIVLAISVAILVYGVQSTITFWQFKWTSIPAISRGWVWISIPLTGFTMTIYTIDHLVTHIKQFIHPELCKKGGDEE